MLGPGGPVITYSSTFYPAPPPWKHPSLASEPITKKYFFFCWYLFFIRFCFHVLHFFHLPKLVLGSVDTEMQSTLKAVVFVACPEKYVLFFVDFYCLSQPVPIIFTSFPHPKNPVKFYNIATAIFYTTQHYDELWTIRKKFTLENQVQRLLVLDKIVTRHRI